MISLDLLMNTCLFLKNVIVGIEYFEKIGQPV